MLTHLLVCGAQADCGIQTLLEHIRECDAQADAILEEADGAVDAVPQRSNDVTCMQSMPTWAFLRATAMWYRLRGILHCTWTPLCGTVHNCWRHACRIGGAVGTTLARALKRMAVIAVVAVRVRLPTWQPVSLKVCYAEADTCRRMTCPLCKVLITMQWNLTRLKSAFILGRACVQVSQHEALWREKNVASPM
jgi:hypothetical protein